MSRTSNALLTETIIASGTITSGRFVTFGGLQVGIQGEKVLGVARTDAGLGEAVAIDVLGIVPVEAGGAITVGADVIADAQGRAIVNPAAATEFVIGTARQAAGGAGQFIEILIR